MFEHVLAIKYCFKAYLISCGIRQSDLTKRCHLQVRQREEVIKVEIFQLIRQKAGVKIKSNSIYIDLDLVMLHSSYGLSYSVIDSLTMISSHLFVNIMCDVTGRKLETSYGSFSLFEIPEA